MPSKKRSAHPEVRRAQRELADALTEACSTEPTEADTGELIKIEEVLAIANDAAKTAISLRRKLRHVAERDDAGDAERAAELDAEAAAERESAYETSRGRGGRPAANEGSQLRAAPDTGVHRVFDDAHGVRWNAFAVYPTELPEGRSPLPLDFRDGWLSFNSETETRRLVPIPSGWINLSNDSLRTLCERATVARRRSSGETSVS